MLKKRISLLVIISLVMAGGSLLNAQDFSQYQKQQLVQQADTLPYRILYPQNFDPQKKYPLVIFLHGRGESGNNNESQLIHGSKLFSADNIQKNYPAIVVFPQCGWDSYWANVKVDTVDGKRRFNFRKDGEPTKAMRLLLELTDDLLGKSYINKKQVYVGGLSMGGMGTFELLRRKPTTFAAAFAICGGGNPETVKKYAKKTSLWVFHGGKDDVVPPKHSEEMVAALKAAGSDVKFSLYPEANHNSWDAAFAEPDLLHWLFSHRR